MRKSVGILRSECPLLTNALGARPSTHFSGYRVNRDLWNFLAVGFKLAAIRTASDTLHKEDRDVDSSGNPVLACCWASGARTLQESAAAAF